MELQERVVWQTRQDYLVENEAKAIELAMRMIVVFLEGGSYAEANRQCDQLLDEMGWTRSRKVYVQGRSLEILEGMKEVE